MHFEMEFNEWKEKFKPSEPRENVECDELHCWSVVTGENGFGSYIVEGYRQVNGVGIFYETEIPYDENDSYWITERSEEDYFFNELDTERVSHETIKDYLEKGYSLKQVYDVLVWGDDIDDKTPENTPPITNFPERLSS